MNSIFNDRPRYLLIRSVLMFLFLSAPVHAAETKENGTEFSSNYVMVDGVSMHYLEHPAPRASSPTYLFLHGNPSSSYLWRNVMPHLKDSGRLIAPDLVGFGRSGKPEIDYTFQSHQAYVDGFVDALDLDNIILVIHDWGSALGLNYARRHPNKILGVAMMEAIVPPRFPMPSYDGFGPVKDLFIQFRDPQAGQKLLVEQNMFVEELLLKGAVTRELSATEKAAYRQPFLESHTRKPILVWPAELPIAGVPARNVVVVEKIGAWLKKSNHPKLVLFANPGAITAPQEALWMQKNYRNLEAVYVGPGTHYIQEDQPDEIGLNIKSWAARNLK